ncbi:hypothetical protein GALMADRAFT_716512 [Galerina marginata CBS 339.88]|uniref:Uncharacterized protein n=1 Tax=Galerina marginata (strain CBS 339.88) TaxID=685588 RepID=A0A067TX40_GALM3|nr:hypothetical protein GALMADRAFT_716512 [Galerina marginata CBS 339.88]
MAPIQCKLSRSSKNSTLCLASVHILVSGESVAISSSEMWLERTIEVCGMTSSDLLSCLSEIHPSWPMHSGEFNPRRNNRPETRRLAPRRGPLTMGLPTTPSYCRRAVQRDKRH